MHTRQVERYAAGVRRFDFDAGMAPYDLASYGSWQALSNHITPVSCTNSTASSCSPMTGPDVLR